MSPLEKLWVPGLEPGLWVPAMVAGPTMVPEPLRIWVAPRVHETAETSRVEEAPTMIWLEVAMASACPSFRVPAWMVVEPV